jgi:hypothetical protein
VLRVLFPFQFDVEVEFIITGRYNVSQTAFGPNRLNQTSPSQVTQINSQFELRKDSAATQKEKDG